MPRQKVASPDPLIAALIAKLPSPGEEFPVERQFAWLNLMAMAFATVYGGNVSGLLVGAPEQPKSPKFVAASSQPAKPSYPFVIDEAGFAKNAKGKRVLAGEVTDAIYDLRGIDGDVKTITWADGSTGLNGCDLTIVAA